MTTTAAEIYWIEPSRCDWLCGLQERPPEWLVETVGSLGVKCGV